MKLVVDTSIIIDNLRNGPNWKRFLKHMSPEDELFIPTVVIVELYSGASTKDGRLVKKMNKTLSYFQRVLLTEDIAKRAGEIYRDGEKHFSLGDYIIAATALNMGAEVVTLNEKHFRKIPGIRIYDFDNDGVHVI